MRRFYDNLWQKKMSKVDALHEAQLWILRNPKELEAKGVRGVTTRGLGTSSQRVDPADIPPILDSFTDPYFWAAFQLSGDWR